MLQPKVNKRGFTYEENRRGEGALEKGSQFLRFVYSVHDLDVAAVGVHNDVGPLGGDWNLDDLHRGKVLSRQDNPVVEQGQFSIVQDVVLE